MKCIFWIWFPNEFQKKKRNFATKVYMESISLKCEWNNTYECYCYICLMDASYTCSHSSPSTITQNNTQFSCLINGNTPLGEVFEVKILQTVWCSVLRDGLALIYFLQIVMEIYSNCKVKDYNRKIQNSRIIWWVQPS